MIYDLKACNLSRLLQKVVLKVNLSRGTFFQDIVPTSERIRLLVSLTKFYSMNINYANVLSCISHNASRIIDHQGNT